MSSTGRVISRRKLDKAMADAGFTSQVELVDKIAESFPESSPKDSVSRMFRGYAVSHKTIIKVTQALEIEYDALFEDENPIEIEKETTDVDSNKITSSQFHSANNRSLLAKTNTNLETVRQNISGREDDRHQSQHTISKKYLIFGVFIVLVISGVYLYFVATKNSLTDPADPTFSFSSDKVTATIIGVEQFNTKNFSDEFANALVPYIELQASNINQFDANIEPWNLIKKLRVDLILEVQKESAGRYDAYFIFAYNDRQKVLLYADVLDSNSVDEKIDDIIQQTSIRLLNLSGYLEPPQMLAPVPSVNAVKALHAGLIMLDKPHNTAFLSIAMSSIYSAVSFAPEYLKPKIQLCRGLVALYIAKKDDSYLQQAENECAAISSEANSIPAYHVAMGDLAQTLMQSTLAEERYKNALEMSPNYVDALLGLANTYAVLAREKQDPSILKEAIAVTEKAEVLAPDYWRAPYTQGKMHYFNGRPDLGIIATERSVSIEKNHANLNSAATLSFCFGDPKVTKLRYEQAIELKFAPPIARYNLGSIYSFFEDYAMAAKQFDLYLHDLAQENSEPNLDQLLGIADIFQQDKQWQRSKLFYQRAYEEAERLRLAGDERLIIRLKLLYLEMVFAGFNEKIMSNEQIDDFFAQVNMLAPLIVEPNGKLLLVYMYMMLEKLESAEPFYRDVSKMCTAFENAPGMSVFKKS